MAEPVCGVRVADLVGAALALAPAAGAESWDNVGLLAGDPEAPLTTVMLAVDLTAAVLTEAEQAGAQAVLCYHPPIFKGLKAVTAPSLVYRAVRAGVALLSLHTALDAVAGGTHDVLADRLGLTDRVAVRPAAAGTAGVGLGRMGRRAPILRREWVQVVKRSLDLSHVMVAGPLEGTAERAAVCAGSCGDLIHDVMRAGAQVYVTGELRHHDALLAQEAGLTLICTLHSNSERAVLALVREHLSRTLPGLRVLHSGADRDPYQWL